MGKKKSLSKAKSAKKAKLAPPKKKFQKGKVFVYTAAGQLVPVEKLKRYEVRKTSKALKEDRQYYKEKGLINPPYSAETFITYYENSGYFMRCVDQVAQDVAGDGYRLVKASEEIDDKNEEVLKVKKEIEEFLRNPNEEDSLQDIIKMLITDWGAVGWWNLEVTRNKANRVNQIYQVPAHTMKVHKSKTKYCQTEWVGGQRKRVWFKKFGEAFSLNDETGEESKKAQKDKEANEMVMHRNHYIRSQYYGTPNILGSIGSVILLITIRDFNLSFFENYGVPAALVVLSGEWEEGSEKELMDFIDNEIKGSDNAHKTLAMRLPEEGGKIDWIPLSMEVKEGSFKIYFKMQRDEVLMCYSMPPYRIGIAEVGSLGGSTAPESTKIYMDSIVKPLQSSIEDIFNNKLLASYWEPEKEGEEIKPLFKFELIPPDTRDLDAEVTRACKLFDRGAMSRSQLAVLGGFPVIDEKDGGNDFYILKSLIPVGEETLATQKDEEFARDLEIESKIDELLESKKVEKVKIEEV